jgi:hypothetical protein
MKLNCDSRTDTINLASVDSSDDTENNSHNNSNNISNQNEQLIQFDNIIKTLIQKQNVLFLNQLNPIQLKTLELLNLNQQQQQLSLYESSIKSEQLTQNENDSKLTENEVKVTSTNGQGTKSHMDSNFDSLARIKIEYNLSVTNKNSIL